MKTPPVPARGRIFQFALVSIIAHAALLTFSYGRSAEGAKELTVKLAGMSRGEGKSATAKKKPDSGSDNGTELAKGSAAKPFDSDSSPAITEQDFENTFYAKNADYREILQSDVFPALRYLDIPVAALLKERSPAKIRVPRMLTQPAANLNFLATLAGAELFAPPLRFPAAARRRYFDDTMRQAKVAQILGFFRRWGRYSADAGDLPAAVRELYFMNLQRIVFDHGEEGADKTAVEYFHEALGKGEVLKTVLQRIRAAPGSRLATELLFVLEDIFLTQKNALRIAVLAATSPSSSPEAVLARQVMQKYRSVANADAGFDRKRLEFLHWIVKTTPRGYRRADAYFRIGLLLWQQGCEEKNATKLRSAQDAWRRGRSSSSGVDKYRDVLHEVTVTDMPDSGVSGCDASPVVHALEKFGQVQLQEKLNRERTLLSASGP